MTKSFTVTKKQESLADVLVIRHISTGDWSQATPNVLVALYKMCHKDVYGVPADDVTGKTYAMAAAMAKRMLFDYFGGDANAMVSFIHWTWTREKNREDRRKESNGASAYRLGWRLQFGNAVLTDYRLSQHRSVVAANGGARTVTDDAKKDTPR